MYARAYIGTNLTSSYIQILHMYPVLLGTCICQVSTSFPCYVPIEFLLLRFLGAPQYPKYINTTSI